jgi:hypothetical protein
MCVQGADAKKEEFRKYLERAGVIDALTKGCLVFWCNDLFCSCVINAGLFAVLVGLYEEPEKPSNALEYALIRPSRSGMSSNEQLNRSFVKQYLGAPTASDVDGIKAENEALKKQVEELTQKVRVHHMHVSTAVCFTQPFPQHLGSGSEPTAGGRTSWQVKGVGGRIRVKPNSLWLFEIEETVSFLFFS